MNETIAAISTALGVGAISIIRISGTDSINIVNKIFGSNLMFISQNFPGMPIEIIYNATGPLFTLVMSLGQMTLPFYMVYGIVKWREKELNVENAECDTILEGKN